VGGLQENQPTGVIDPSFPIQQIASYDGDIAAVVTEGRRKVRAERKQSEAQSQKRQCT
jgi:hypothetical protein